MDKRLFALATLTAAAMIFAAPADLRAFGGKADRPAETEPSNDPNPETVARLAADAEAGKAAAQSFLGMMYLEGRGVPKNEAEAAKWFAKAAAQEHLVAIVNLARLYEAGRGTAKDEAKAFGLFGQAAQRGHGPSRLALAQMLLDGRGSAKNPVEAYALLLAVAERSRDVNRQTAIELLDELTKKLTAAEIDSAKKRAAAWNK